MRRHPLRNGLLAVAPLLLAVGTVDLAPATAAEAPVVALEVPAEVAEALVDGPVEVIVAHAPGAPSPAAEQRAVARADGDARVVERWDHLPVQLVRVDSPEALADLTADPSVTDVSLPTTYRRMAAPNLELIDQPAAAAAGFTGAGSAVAVLDTGLDLPLTGGLFGDCRGGPGTGSCRIDFHENADGTVFTDLDPERHGTNVASVVASVAPQAHLRIYGVFSRHQGELVTTSEIVLAALDHLAGQTPAVPVRAVNLSLGDPSDRTDGECADSPFAPVFAHLRSIGITPVIAAGNDASTAGIFLSGLPEPACAPGAVRVGAVYTSDVEGSAAWGGGIVPDCVDLSPRAATVTCFSQTGPLLSLLAPGVDVQAGGVTLSGTSQAAPHVAGAVAVLHQANRDITPTGVVTALTSSGPLITDTRTAPATQRRLLDVAAASRRALPVDVQRIQGADRVATALATSRASFPAAGSAGAVVLASSENFPDGLAGTPLAFAERAPVLLTPSASLRGDVAAEIDRVLPAGGTVFVLGGTGALAPAVEGALAGAGHQVRRVAGPDRYATAVAIADLIDTPERVLLATGRNFPDALAAGVAAAQLGGVVLFTQGNTQAPATGAWLDAHRSVPRTVVGGTASGSVPGAAEIVGATRYETATKLATAFFGSSPTVVGVASGVTFPDALSGGAHIARLGGPVLLTTPAALPGVVTAWLSGRGASLQRAVLFGGTGAIAAAVEGQVRGAAI